MEIPMKSAEVRLLGLAEAGRFLGVTARTVQNLIRRGVIQPVRLPGLRRTLLDKGDLESLVASGRQARDA